MPKFIIADRCPARRMLTAVRRARPIVRPIIRLGAAVYRYLHTGRRRIWVNVDQIRIPVPSVNM